MQRNTDGVPVNEDRDCLPIVTGEVRPFVYYGVSNHAADRPASADMKFTKSCSHIRSGARFIDHRDLAGDCIQSSFHTVMHTDSSGRIGRRARIPTVA